MTGPPDLGDLLPDDLEPGELERLRRVHELLLAAGPPAELPPHLAQPPQPDRGRVVAFARYRWKAAGLAAAAAAAILFGIGFLAGHSTSGGDFKAVYGPIAMHGSGGTANALAQIWIGPKDAAHNWTSQMKVRGLPALPAGSYYALYLTEARTGKRVLLCTAFAVHKGVTTVSFSYPGDATGKGWVIVADDTGAGDQPAAPLLWTTPSAAAPTA